MSLDRGTSAVSFTRSNGAILKCNLKPRRLAVDRVPVRRTSLLTSVLKSLPSGGCPGRCSSLGHYASPWSPRQRLQSYSKPYCRGQTSNGCFGPGSMLSNSSLNAMGGRRDLPGISDPSHPPRVKRPSRTARSPDRHRDNTLPTMPQQGTTGTIW
ncbi:hypothetical protein DPEC_G00328940 [Dallia pectoralis]|uniref:Uncharacterized protein n=1 Tax=Dallia pectoralis TaxID=75939 RepID=A0ACC2F8M2_DALPE|nr:hypothetical protein DPEC_G00328940 [Dallia pectoralis]